MWPGSFSAGHPLALQSGSGRMSPGAGTGNLKNHSLLWEAGWAGGWSAGWAEGLWEVGSEKGVVLPPHGTMRQGKGIRKNPQSSVFSI